VGTAYNVDLSSSDTASIKGLKGDQAAGGMDTGTDTRVLASVDSDNKFTLSHTSTGLAATVTIGTNTLGTSENGADFSTWVQETYANDGEAQNTTHNDSKQPMTFLWKDETGAGEPQEITFDYKPTGSSASASTQSAGASEVLYLFQDGSTRGTLDSLTISDDGEITGNFSNGTLQTLGSIYLAGFADAGSLERSGENLWSKTRDSGQPNINNPNQGGMGKLQSRALEQSNVDLAEQFVKMINYQRAFQANSRTISTTDQMLNELVNLKR
jgi:flagellar hook protein FlgE